MKSFLKPSLTGVLLITGALHVSAQKLSEQELKTNVNEITNSTSTLMKLKPVTFQYDLKKYPGLKLSAGKKYGFVAADLQAEFPELVTESVKTYSAGKNNLKTVQYTEVAQANLIPLLVAAVKEQQEEIELLKKELELLKDKSDHSTK